LRKIGVFHSRKIIEPSSESQILRPIDCEIIIYVGKKKKLHSRRCVVCQKIRHNGFNYLSYHCSEINKENTMNISSSPTQINQNIAVKNL
jgi:hypothetical protein